MVSKTNYSLMQVKSIAECSKGHSAILSTFIKLPVVIKTFVLSIFEWPFYTGLTVLECTMYTCQKCDKASARQYIEKERKKLAEK